MGYNIGPTVAVKGESEYSKSLAQIKANMKLVASEAAVMSAQFGKNNSSVDSLKAKNLLLSKAMGEQKKAVSNAEQALKRMDAEGVKPTDRSYVQMKTNLNNAKAALQTTKKEIAENEAAMKKGEKGAGQYSEKLKHVRRRCRGCSGKITQSLFGCSRCCCCRCWRGLWQARGRDQGRGSIWRQHRQKQPTTRPFARSVSGVGICIVTERVLTLTPCRLA